MHDKSLEPYVFVNRLPLNVLTLPEAMDTGAMCYGVLHVTIESGLAWVEHSWIFSCLNTLISLKWMHAWYSWGKFFELTANLPLTYVNAHNSWRICQSLSNNDQEETNSFTYLTYRHTRTTHTWIYCFTNPFSLSLFLSLSLTHTPAQAKHHCHPQQFTQKNQIFASNTF